MGRRSDGLCDKTLDCWGGESSSAVGDEGLGVVERVDISPDVRDVGRTGLGGPSTINLSNDYNFGGGDK